MSGFLTLMSKMQARTVLTLKGLRGTQRRPEWYNDVGIGNTNRMKRQLACLVESAGIPLMETVCTGGTMQSIAPERYHTSVTHIIPMDEGMLVRNYHSTELDWFPQHERRGVASSYTCSPVRHGIGTEYKVIIS